MKINFQNKIIRIIFTLVVALEAASFVFDFSIAQVLPGNQTAPGTQTIPGTIAPIATPRKLDVSAYIINNENKEIPNGEYDVRFAFYSTDRAAADAYPSNTDNRLWEETQKVTIQNGIMKAYLGTVNPLPASLNFAAGEYFLGIRIGEDSEMVPRKKVGAVPLAIDSLSVGGATIGTGAGNILQLGTNGKINIKNLPTGKSGNTLVLSNDSRLGAGKITISGQSYIKASGMKLTLNQINLASDVTGILPVANGGTGIGLYDAGDMTFYSAGSAMSKLAIGNAGEVLTVVGGLPSWQPAAGTIDGSGAAGHITFWQDANTLGYDNVGNFYIDAATHRLGVGTVNPGQTLSVNGTFGIQSGNFATIFQTQAQAQNLTYTWPAAYPAGNGYILTSTTGGNFSWTPPGAASISMGGSISGGATPGSVLFIDVDSKLAQDPSGFYWNDTLDRLGLGTSAPNYTLDVAGTAQATGFRVNSETITDWTGTGLSIVGGTLTAHPLLTLSGAHSYLSLDTLIYLLILTWELAAPCCNFLAILCR